MASSINLKDALCAPSQNVPMRAEKDRLKVFPLLFLPLSFHRVFYTALLRYETFFYWIILLHISHVNLLVTFVFIENALPEELC